MAKKEFLLKMWKDGEDIKHSFKLLDFNQEDLARFVLEFERILTKLKNYYNRKSYDKDISWENEYLAK